MFNNKKISILFLLLAFTFTGCEKYFGDVNEDPNNPIDVGPDVLLPSAMGDISYALGGDYSRFTSVLIQHANGVTRQWVYLQDYGFSPTDVNTMWRFSLYGGSLHDLKILIEKADAEGLEHYAGIGRVVLAYDLMLATDMWNAIPYSEAFKGTEQLQPKFDSQEQIYGNIITLLSEAKPLLAANSGAVVGSDDLIYGGDMAAWSAMAHVLKARAHLHLSGRDASNYNAALTELANGFSSSADDALFTFPGGANAAPWYQYNTERGDMGPSMGLHNIMIANDPNDPRIAVYYPSGLGGVWAGSHPVFTATRALPWITYMEQEFMKAECLIRTGGADADIHAALSAGVQASFATMGLDGSSHTIPAIGNITLEDVLREKYIAMFTDPETFNDWRRTDYPNLTPNVGTAIPTRFPYPETEILYNNNTPSITIYDKVWWDVN